MRGEAVFGLSLIAFIAFPGVTKASSDPAAKAFLERLGFVDRVAALQRAQADHAFDSEMNRRQQNRNIKSYATINESRDLALEVFEALRPRLQEPSTRDSLIEFSARMLALQPMPPRTDYPVELMHRPAGEERSLAIAQWLADRRAEQMELHARRLTSEIADLLYGAEIAAHTADVERLYGRIAVIIDRVYMDSLIGETRFFGRALAALLAREERTSRTPFLADLATKVRARGLHLENFLGDRWVFDTPKGPQSLAIETGALFATRNLSRDSLQISFAAVARDRATAKRAKKLGLIGKIRSYPFYVTAQDAAQGMGRWDRARDRLQQLDLAMSTGFSHQGAILVREDAETGIKMSWTIDNYPAAAADESEILANPGGVRFTGLEQILDSSHHSKIAIAPIDHRKFREWARESHDVVGYPRDGVIFDAQALALQDANPVVAQPPRRDPWRIQISNDEYERLHAIDDADQWYREASARFADQMLEMMDRGVYFQWVLDGVSLKGGAYCSETIFLAWLAGTGVSIDRLFPAGQGAKYMSTVRSQSAAAGFASPDGWSWHVRTLSNLGVIAQSMKDKGLMTSVADQVLGSGMVQQAQTLVKMQIVSPSGALAQPHSRTRVLDLIDRPLGERIRAPYREDSPLNADALARTNAVLPREEKLRTAPHDATETAGAALRDIEYRMAIFGARGEKTEGLDVEVIAIDGSKRELERLKADWESRGRPNEAVSAGP